MAVSKVILNGTTLIDLTQDTVVTTHVVDDDTFHDAAGVASAGTMPVYAGANHSSGYSLQTNEAFITFHNTYTYPTTVGEEITTSESGTTVYVKYAPLYAQQVSVYVKRDDTQTDISLTHEYTAALTQIWSFQMPDSAVTAYTDV